MFSLNILIAFNFLISLKIFLSFSKTNNPKLLPRYSSNNLLSTLIFRAGWGIITPLTLLGNNSLSIIPFLILHEF